VRKCLCFTLKHWHY